MESSPFSLSTAVTSRSVRARPIAAISSRRSSASNGALAEAALRAIPSSTSTRCWVPSTPPRGMVLGHNPSCRPAMTTTSHSRPSAACATQHRDRVGAGCASRGAAGRPNAATWSTKAAQGRPGGACDVLLGDVEQRDDGVEVTIGLRAGGAAAFAGREPAPLQPGAMPCLPQRVPGVQAVGCAAARRGAAPHRPAAAGEPGPRKAVRGRVSSAATSRSANSRGGVPAEGGAPSRRGAAPGAADAVTPGRPGRSGRSAVTAPGHRPARPPSRRAPSAALAPRGVRREVRWTPAGPPARRQR